MKSNELHRIDATVREVPAAEILTTSTIIAPLIKQLKVYGIMLSVYPLYY